MPGPQALPEEHLRAQLQRLQAELDQARALLETSEERARQLGHECQRLQQERLQPQLHEIERIAALQQERETQLALALEHVGAWSWEWVLRQERAGDIPAPLPDWLESAIPEDRERVERTLTHCLRQRKSAIAVEYRTRAGGRGERWISARGRLLCDAQGRPLRIVGLSTDITHHKADETALRKANIELQRRVAEEVSARQQAQELLFQKQKLEALGQLTGGVAHDFNNLLAVVSNGAYLLLKVQDPERRNQLVEQVLTAVRRGSELTRRLLAFGRRQELRPELLDASSTLKEFRGLLQPSLRHDIEFELRIADDVWQVKADRGELQLSLLNLCLNARDAMPEGGTIRLAVANRILNDQTAGPWQLPTGEYVAFSVRDTGVGMSAEVAEHAFEPFFTTKDVGEGTGLGLPQVYGFARQSGGGVRIDSRPGEGTEVTLLLPRAANGARLADASDAGVHVRGASILVVEDDDTLASLVIETLVRWDHDVTRVATAKAALDCLAQRSFDLLFTDVLLPAGMNGLDLARRARREHPKLRVILTSGYGGPLLNQAQAEDLPVLYKPYQPDTLENVITQVLAGRLPRRH